MRALTLSASASLLLAATAAAQTYEPVLTVPRIEGSPATATPINLGDDNTAQIDLGFEFTYWGQIFTRAWVSSNGFVSFGTSANLCCNGAPVEQAPRNTIYGFWTDLVSYSGNPYYTRGDGSILFGWYDTQEYGTQNRVTFEIGLSSDSSIRFNFGNLASLTYHQATAGITGPGAEDNLQLFYGSNTQFLKNQSGILRWIAPEPVVTVDCAITPMDPSCPPQTVAPVQTIAAAPIETIQEAYAADVQADQAEAAVLAVAEPVQEVETALAVEETVSITEQVAELAAAERLSPDQVAALAAPGVAVALATTAETSAPIFIQQTAVGGSSGASSAFIAAFESASPSGGATSAANTLEVLNTLSAPAPQMAMDQQQQPAANAMAEGQGETMAAIAAVPGFAAYTQVSLQDRPDFYAPRDIYKNRRLRDANFEMYRLTRANTDKLQELIDAQYR